MDWRAVWAAAGGQIVDLPTYPFQRERCWFTAHPAAARSAGRDTGHPLLGLRLRSALADIAQFEVTLHAETTPFLRDHRVLGRSICPATGFVEMALAAGRALTGTPPALEHVAIVEPLVLAEQEPRVVQVVVRRGRDGTGTFDILSLDPGAADGTWRTHAQGAWASARRRAVSGTARVDPRPVCHDGRRRGALRAPRHPRLPVRTEPPRRAEDLPARRRGARRDRAAGAVGVRRGRLRAASGAARRVPAGSERGHSRFRRWKRGLPAVRHRAAPMVPCARAPSSGAMRELAGPASPSWATLRADVTVFDDDGVMAEIRGLAFRAASDQAAASGTAMRCRFMKCNGSVSPPRSRCPRRPRSQRRQGRPWPPSWTRTIPSHVARPSRRSNGSAPPGY